MSEVVNIHEAKTHLSRLLEQVQGGKEIILAKAGKRDDACAVASRAATAWAHIKALGNLGAMDVRKNLPQSEALQKKFCTA